MANVAMTVAKADADVATVNKDRAFKTAMEPANLDAMYKIAAALVKINLCGVKTPEEALVRMLAGRELGLTMMQAMRGIYIVEGNPSLSANLKQAICLAHPEVCALFVHVESSDKFATYRAQRVGGEAQEFTYTIEDANTAQLVNRGSDPKKNNWNRYARRMLQARAKSEAADVLFGDLLFGFATREELEDDAILVRHVPHTPDSSSKDVTATSEPVVQAAARDFDDEAASLKEAILNVKTAAERKALREKIDAFSNDAGEPYAGELKSFYNMNLPSKAAANGPQHTLVAE